MENSSISVLADHDGHQFQGRHMMASLVGCSTAALLNVEMLLENFSAAATAAGATVLDARHHVFPNGGMTAVLLLSESHASIHTYPENGACFVDLFTCGTAVDQSKFNQVLSAYLTPSQVNQNVFNRGLTAELVESA
jgi:S-adenosylmethionine decarboxylase proenzyme